MRIGNSVIHKSESVTYREMDGEGILYNSQNKNMHVLNKTALAVWNLFDAAEDPQDIANTLAERYDVAAETVLGDVLTCLKQFETLGLIGGLKRE